MKKMFGSTKKEQPEQKEKTEAYSVNPVNTISPITLEDIKKQQDKILEMISMEKFQERLCTMIQEEIHSSVKKQSELAQRRITNKMEADIANVQLVIVNKVVEEITNHIDRRIEKRLKDLERQIEELEKNDKVKNVI
jgi:uncharacterized membrane protein YheB (UPF0754 family)